MDSEERARLCCVRLLSYPPCGSAAARRRRRWRRPPSSFRPAAYPRRTFSPRRELKPLHCRRHHSPSYSVCGIMERVSSATATEVEDAISIDQSGRSGKKRAKVWAYIDTELIDGVEKAVCKYCKLQLSSVPGKGTTHLNRHIGYYCHHIPQEDRDTFLASLKNTPRRDNSVFDPVVFRGLIANHC
ncbi:hypothetical protein PVAP13_3NG155001 [Panicum virgatum]|uniref:BED-type domain-containing protein n=1 Tax=Panicum virgatum TaxID=38727 RepID=A0A8T0UHL5_PANVG|nr:hypothetical protein PVAP13_3NG155001 [Panicum virgatum]